MAEMYFLGNSTKGQMFGSLFLSEDKSIMFDGGTLGDAQYLGDLLREKAKGHVDAWFFTHPHQDHIGAFLKIKKDMPQITTDKIYCDFPEFEMLEQFGKRVDFEVDLWRYFFGFVSEKSEKTFHRVKKGENFDFNGINIRVLRTFNREITDNFVNNSSSVYMVSSEKKKVLILGDIGVESGRELIKMYKPENLYSDYIQMSHHGQNGADEEFYKYVKPQACLWPTPDWLWDNDNGGGFDSGPWATLKTRDWMKSLGVKEHIVAKDGTARILL